LGDGVVLIAAETLACAHDAAEKIVIDHEELPANVSVAMAENSERTWPEAEGNICFSYQLGDCSATETDFAHANLAE
jgi:aerobic carbon-monoxide dehydrogenase large subunit